PPPIREANGGGGAGGGGARSAESTGVCVGEASPPSLPFPSLPPPTAPLRYPGGGGAERPGLAAAQKSVREIVRPDERSDIGDCAHGKYPHIAPLMRATTCVISRDLSTSCPRSSRSSRASTSLVQQARRGWPGQVFSSET